MRNTILAAVLIAAGSTVMANTESKLTTFKQFKEDTEMTFALVEVAAHSSDQCKITVKVGMKDKNGSCLRMNDTLRKLKVLLATLSKEKTMTPEDTKKYNAHLSSEQYKWLKADYKNRLTTIRMNKKVIDLYK